MTKMKSQTSLESAKSDRDGDRMATNIITKDSGYSWVILFSVFMSHVFIYGVTRTTGIFYVEFLKALKYNTTSQVALAPAMTAGFMYTIGPIAGFLVNRFGCRRVGVVGGLMSGLGLGLSSLTTNVHITCLTFGALTGIGFGLNFLAGISMLSLHFDKYRSLAIAVGTSGVGVGVLVYPMFIRYLIDLFGWSGAVLITAALTLNLAACAMCFPSYDSQKAAVAHTEKILRERGEEDEKCENDFMNLRLFKNWSYTILCLNGMLFCFGVSVIYVHLAVYAQSQGMSDNEAAALFSTIGVTNFLGRYILGALSRLPHCSSGSILHLAGGTISGIIIMTAPLLPHNYYYLQFVCGLFGLTSAVLGVMVPVVILDVLGPTSMAMGYGNLLLFEAIGQVLGAPTASLLHEYTKQYPSSMYLGGSAVVLSSLTMIYIIIKKFHKRAPEQYMTVSQTIASHAIVKSQTFRKMQTQEKLTNV